MEAERGTHLFLFRGLILIVPEEVQTPKAGSTLLARAVEFGPGDEVLELGTGAGLTALVAGRRARRVLATDISPECVSCARQNALLNGFAERLEFRTGDLFEPVAGRHFDKILMNPPQMPIPASRKRRDLQALADDGGADGWQILDRLIAAAPEYLQSGGMLAFTLFDFLGEKKAFAKLRRAGLTPRVLEQEREQFPRLGYERLEYLRSLDEEGTISREEPPADCRRLVLAGEKV